jgi:hypothetical protein
MLTRSPPASDEPTCSRAAPLVGARADAYALRLLRTHSATGCAVAGEGQIATMTQLKTLSMVAVLLAGCTQADTLSTDSAGSPLSDDLVAGTPDVAGAPDGRPGAQHQDCSNGGACLPGLSCLARVGPLDRQVATCEIRCDAGCPGGQSCVYLVEGPGEVCWQVDGGGRFVALGTQDTLPQQGEPCPDRVCDRGLTCVAFYGFAGPAGGLFTSCEIPCGDKDRCPGGQQCVTIADGPGEVCRPVER